MSTAVSSHGGTGPLSLMSCVRESSPPQDLGPEYEIEKTVSTKKRFWNPRKWFRRKNNKVADDIAATNDVEPKESLRSRSTSELSEPEEPSKRRSGVPMHPGLSVSHDSVFHSPHSGSEIELEGAHSSSSLSTHHNVLGGDRLQTELIERLRLRRGRGDTSEDDEGLPRSPCNSPTATDKTANKDHPTKSHSTCSEGSLISMGSSEMDEDSSGQQSHHSSKVSLQDKKSYDGDLELETVQSSSYPLNHSAAHHRVSVRPSRRHGAPRRRRMQQMSTTALPTTLEVNEESSVRSSSPEITIREAVSELYSNATVSKPSRFLTINQLKCSSLPPGLASPSSDSNKLHRSRSNAGTKSQDEIGTLGEEDEPNDKKSDSFLGKLFPIRRSGKKKRTSKEEKIKEDKGKGDKEKDDVTDASSFGVSAPINIERKPDMPPKPLPRSGAAARQRVIPHDIPASPELRHEELILPKSSPEKSNLPSPLHLELESRLQQRMATVSSKSPPNSPTSPAKSPIMEKHFIKHSKVETTTETNRSKVVIAGLSQFQKKAITHHSEEKDYKSLTEFPKDEEKLKPIVVKSHSFKTTKNINQPPDNKDTSSKESEIIKSNSFESIKNVDLVTVEKQRKTEIVDVKVKTESKFVDSGITISGPSHKAIVSIGNTNNEVDTNIMQKVSEEHKKNDYKSGEAKLSEVKEHQVSVTKIQVKKESTHVIKNPVPEFMNVQLHKVEKANNNLVLSTGFTKNEDIKARSPPIVENTTEGFGKETEKINKTEVITSTSTKIEYEAFEKSKVHIENVKFNENPKILIENPKVLMENTKVHMETPKVHMENLKTNVETSKIQIKNVEVHSEQTETAYNENSKIQVKDNVKMANDDFLKPTIENEHLKLNNEMEKLEITKVRNETEQSKLQGFIFEKSKIQNENSKFQKENSKVDCEKLHKSDVDQLKVESKKLKVESEKLKVESEKPKFTETPKTESVNFKAGRSMSVLHKPNVSSEKTKIKMERSVSESDKSKVEPDKSKLEAEKFEVEKSKLELEKSKMGKTENVRKFSKDDIEIIEKNEQEDKKHVTTALVTITPMTPTPKSFKKPDNLPLRKSFVADKLEKPVLKVKSSSLDMVEIKQEKDDKSSQKADEKVELRPKTHSANDITDTNQVTYRRKSIINQKKDDEPELMKVFARRSLKLKDSESEALSQQVVKMIEEEKEAAKSRDSDKENQNESPPEERKKKFDPEVTLRKPIVNNKIASSYQRAVSLNQKTNEVNTEKMQKQYSLLERPKTEWIKPQDDIIAITEKGTFIEEDKPKNFNQKMAEWEKRAQSVRKTSP